MSDENEQQKSRRTGMWFAFGLAGTLVLYVLSSGPVAALAEKFGWDGGPLQTIYAPLIWLHDHWSPAEEFFTAYTEIWKRLLG